MTDTTKSTFKVGDRVRLTGERFGPMRDEIVRVDGEDLRGFYFFRKEARWYIYKDGDHSAEFYDSAPPPPDTRKRLREYTDLENGDTVVIGGVALTMKNNGFHSEFRTCALGYESIADFFVDEVRRKPRTKKRRVYEEVSKGDEHKGDLLVFDEGDLAASDGRRTGTGCTVFRLVEETEVLR